MSTGRKSVGFYRRPAISKHLTAWAAELQRLARESPEDAATVMRYILTVAGDQSFEDIRTQVIEVAPAAEVTMATAAEQLIQHGRTLGKAEGVLAVLESRGLSVSAGQRARILGCKDMAPARALVAAGHDAQRGRAVLALRRETLSPRRQRGARPASRSLVSDE